MAQIHVDLISGHETSDNDNVQDYDFEDSNDSTNKIPEYPEASYEEYDSSDNAIYDSDHSYSDDEFPQEYPENVDDANNDYNSVDTTITDNDRPGGDLQSCVDVCPGQFGAKVFGLCVGSCGKRCP